MRNLFSKIVRTFAPASTVVASDAPASFAVSSQSIENLEDRKLFSAGLTYGINANDISSSTYPHIVQMMRDTGSNTARLWISLNSTGHNETGIFKYIRKFKADGFDVMATIEPSSTNFSASSFGSYCDWIAGDLGSSVDRWQIGNEVDKSFGTSASSLGKYVNNYLAPAYQAFHAHGEKVVSGSVSWNPDDIKTLVGQGMLSYCDFVGYHPYRPNLDALKSAISEVKSYVGGKPLIASEWNARGHEGNMSDWNAAIKEFWPVIRDNFYAAYYFAAVKVNTMAGPAGVITESGSPNGQFYSTFDGLSGSGGGGGVINPPSTPVPPTPPVTPVTPPVVTPTDPGTGTGNSPSSTGKPTIAGFAIYDGITGQVLKGYEDVTASTTIKLSGLTNKQIQIRALTSSNAGSVKFSFGGRATRTENTAPYTVFANSKGAESPWYATAGSYTLSATGFTADNDGGTAGAIKSLVLKFV